MEKVAIRGINILACRNECEFVEFLMSEHEIKTGKLIAINAEKIIAAEKQAEIKELLRQAEYNYADGMSIVFSIKKKYPQFAKIERIAGVDLWQVFFPLFQAFLPLLQDTFSHTQKHSRRCRCPSS